MQRALRDPLSEMEKEQHCVAEVRERGRRMESQAPLLKQTWADVIKAPCSRGLGPQLPIGLMGDLALNLFAGPGCAVFPRGGSKYLQPAVGPASHAPHFVLLGAIGRC